MGDARSSGQARNLTDPVLALAVYWLRADVMHTLVHDTEDAWLEDAAAQDRVRDLHRLLAIGTLRGGRRVQRLKLDATQVTELSDPRVDTLRLFRNGCFHYQRDYRKFAPFLSGDWGSSIGLNGWTCSSALTSPSTARSHRLGRIMPGRFKNVWNASLFLLVSVRFVSAVKPAAMAIPKGGSSPGSCFKRVWKWSWPLLAPAVPAAAIAPTEVPPIERKS